MGAQVSPRLPVRLTFDAFAKAIELDSAFAPAYEHIVDLALLLREPEAARKYAEAYLRLRLNPKTAASLKASLDLLAHPETPSPATTAFFDTAPAQQVWDVWYYISGAVDSGEAAVAAARAFAASHLGVDSGFAERQRWVLARTLAYRGHFREAARELESHRPWEEFATNLTVADLLALGGLPRGAAAEWLESLLREGSIWAWAGLGWWATVGDTSSLRRFQELAQSKIRSSCCRKQRCRVLDVPGEQCPAIRRPYSGGHCPGSDSVRRLAGFALSVLLSGQTQAGTAPLGTEAGPRGSRPAG